MAELLFHLHILLLLVLERGKKNTSGHNHYYYYYYKHLMTHNWVHSLNQQLLEELPLQPAVADVDDGGGGDDGDEGDFVVVSPQQDGE